MTARILDISPDEYHTDPTGPTLSASAAKTLIMQSPAHCWSEHPKLGAAPRESTDAQDAGTLIHYLLLGRGPTIDIIDADSYRTNVAKELRDESLAAGRVPVLRHKHESAERAAATLRQRIADHGIDLSAGRNEVAIEFEENGLEGPVKCRCLIDHLELGNALIVDVKKIVSADKGTRDRHGFIYGMDIQHASNVSAVTKLEPELLGRVDFKFLFVEVDPPYAVVPCPVSGAFAALGESRWLRAVQLWERCLARDEWPCYEPSPLEPPGWAMAMEEQHHL